MGANRDELVFSSEDEAAFDLGMPAHLTFGHGLHRCLGVPLARLQLTKLLRALSIRFPDLQVVNEMSSLDWKSGMATGGLSQMLVSW
jgi:cytochrome P450